jgi:mRNA interferase YafQ
MKSFIKTTRFKKNYKLMIKRGANPQKLQEVLICLMTNSPLPTRFKPHKLNGEYEGLWECHIEPDWLLIYDIADEFIELISTGTHSDLF